MRTIRSILVVFVGGTFLLLAAQFLCNSPAYVMPRDFPEYWASGRLILRGENPYDPGRILAEEQLIDPHRDEPLMMWNPPPALVLYMPFGVLPHRQAGLLWTGVQLVAMLIACNLLLQVYYPQFNSKLALVLACSFVATWWVVVFGQNSAFLLLGLAGFIHSTQHRKPLRAGAYAALTALKPHLVAGFGMLLLIDLLSRSRRTAVLAGAGVIALALGVALLANPRLLSEYIAATRDPGPGVVPLSDWAVPMPAYWLRMKLFPQHFSVQFLPCAIGCFGLLIWRLIAAEKWQWPQALPAVVAVSAITAPYGWIFDLTVLLVPVVWSVSHLARANAWSLFALTLVGQAAITIISLVMVVRLDCYWWVAPAVLGLCLPGMRVGRVKGTEE